MVRALSGKPRLFIDNIHYISIVSSIVVSLRLIDYKSRCVGHPQTHDCKVDLRRLYAFAAPLTLIKWPSL
jgi:hypothetical protein